MTEGSNNALSWRDGSSLGLAGILHVLAGGSARFAAEAQFEVEERAFTPEEAQGADEAFSTAASLFVMPVVEVDGKAVGTGKPGPVATRLREIYIDEMRKAAI